MSESINKFYVGEIDKKVLVEKLLENFQKHSSKQIWKSEADLSFLRKKASEIVDSQANLAYAIRTGDDALRRVCEAELECGSTITEAEELLIVGKLKEGGLEYLKENFAIFGQALLSVILASL